MSRIEVTRVRAGDLDEPLRLLEEWLRDDQPVPDGFIEQLRGKVGAGDLEVLAAHLDGSIAGVLVLAFRPNISLGGSFASIEDLYVVPEARRRGVGAALLQAAEERCTGRGISYLEVQIEENEAGYFYAASGYEPEPDVRVFSRSLPLGRSAGRKAKG